jgi:hypothetical protein
MCDVQECPHPSIKKITLISKTPAGDIKSDVSLCTKHLDDLTGAVTGYSMGCNYKAVNDPSFTLIGPEV